MSICPNCEYEYVEGITICPDCGIPLVDEQYFEKPEEWTEKNWEVVFTSHKEYEIDMLKDNLDGAGIVSAVLSQQDRNFPAPGDLGLVKLMVRKEDVPAALAFIEKVLGPGASEDENQIEDEGENENDNEEEG